MVFFYALIREITFLISIKSRERMKIMESIFKPSSKVPISFYYIIPKFAKGNTFLRFIFYRL